MVDFNMAAIFHSDIRSSVHVFSLVTELSFPGLASFSRALAILSCVRFFWTFFDKPKHFFVVVETNEERTNEEETSVHVHRNISNARIKILNTFVFLGENIVILGFQ